MLVKGATEGNFIGNPHYIYPWHEFENYYRESSNIRRTLVANKVVDHSDVVGASAVGAAPTTSSFSIPTLGFNRSGKYNCKTRRDI